MYNYKILSAYIPHFLCVALAYLDSHKYGISYMQIGLAGLDYLHSGCHPSIIHRNIKNTTILLDNKMVAKLSNFGLSRETPLEGDPHVSTIVLGTTGYLDPEYDSNYYNYFVQVLVEI